MTVSFIILNYKSKLLTRECVKGILNAGFDFDFEVIVVDNGSCDSVCALMDERFGDQVQCISLKKNIGMGAGNNVGFKKARGEYVMVLNPDTVLTKQSVEPLLAFAEEHKKAGIIAPKLLNPDGTMQHSAHKFPDILMPFYRRTPLGRTNHGKQYLAEYTISENKLTQATTVDWVFGPAFLISREVVEKIGGYDERFFLFLEDTDLCKSVWNAGYEVWYIPDAIVIHYPHRLSGHTMGLLSLTKKTTWNHIASWIKYFWKWSHVVPPSGTLRDKSRCAESGITSRDKSYTS